MGWSAPGVRLVQILPLHFSRLRADAAGDYGALLERRHHRHPDLDACGGAALAAELGVVCVPGVLCREDADVASSHLASGCACRGTDRRFGDPGRYSSEDGRLRLPALFAADVSVGLA